MKKTYAFIDASNLFYGGEKSLGWKIDYSKLRKYLKNKYNVSEAYYFGGVEIKITGEIKRSGHTRYPLHV